MTGGATVGDVARHVLEAFPAQWAEGWDNVGLVLGDATQEVRGVLVTLDPTPAVIRRAAKTGWNLVVTHHPPFFEPPSPLAASGSRGIGALAQSLGVSIVSAHTNLDRAPAGGDALCAALGIEPLRPLETAPQPMSLVITYVPAEHLDAVADAMSLAGAGRIGLYDGCAFVSEGEGRYLPMPGAEPFAGTVDEPTRSPELRLEMVCAREGTAHVLAAAVAAHPYDEPVVLAADTLIARGAARLGRLCELSSATTLGALARDIGERLSVNPRVWGAETTAISRVATATGSGGSLIGDAISARAQVLIAGEVRYHDAVDAVGRGLAVIEAGHDATEWPLIPVLADAVRATPDLAPAFVNVDRPIVGWWTPNTSDGS